MSVLEIISGVLLIFCSLVIILLVLGAAALLCGCMGLRAMKKRKNT